MDRARREAGWGVGAMIAPSFIWSLYYPAPETRKWRITGIEVDGKIGLEVEVFMYCEELRHSPKLNVCRVCRRCHELPKPTDERYAYKWYPMKPSLKSIVQWNRRNWERIIKEELAPKDNKIKVVKTTNEEKWNEPLTDSDVKTWNKIREKFWFNIND